MKSTMLAMVLTILFVVIPIIAFETTTHFKSEPKQCAYKCKCVHDCYNKDFSNQELLSCLISCQGNNND